jgi:GT2 family glycosyltransferase
VKASVVITSYNDDKRLRLTLWGWAGQSVKDFELNVVDDGGDTPGETQRLVLSFARYMKVSYSYLQPSKKAMGGQIFRLSAARNLGIRRSSGETLVISDGDTIPAPNVVSVMLGSARPDRVLIGIRKRLPMHAVNTVTPAHLTRLETLVYQDDERLTNPQLRALFLSLRDSRVDGWGLCWGCLFAAPLGTVKALGGFDERFQSWGGEDEDMAERLARGKGLGFHAVPEAVVYHLDHPSRDPAPYTAATRLEEIRKNWTAVRNGGAMS